jgi:predicted RNA-binding protein with RPS1 domain
MIEEITREVEVGKIYDAKVVKMESFGCFVQLWPGCEGLVHISELAHERVEKTEDVVSLGDEIIVKALGTDKKGRQNFSRKEALPKPKKAPNSATSKISPSLPKISSSNKSSSNAPPSNHSLTPNSLSHVKKSSKLPTIKSSSKTKKKLSRKKPKKKNLCRTLLILSVITNLALRQLIRKTLTLKITN